MTKKFTINKIMFEIIEMRGNIKNYTYMGDVQ